MTPTLEKATANLAAGFIESRKISHTMIALSATAAVEEGLKECLKITFRPLKRQMLGRLFEAYGPLSSFAGKIDMAYALSIVDEDTFTELNKLRKIRNRFAHSTERLTFEEEPVLSLFNNLKRPPGAKGTYADVFFACVTAIVERLNEYEKTTKEKRTKENPATSGGGNG